MKERGWAKLDMTVSNAASDHEVGLLSQYDPHTDLFKLGS